METLKKRTEFLRVAKGRRASMPGMVVQMAPTPSGPADSLLVPGTTIRVGYTVTKKVGNAVVRNRVRRRLRAAAGRILADRGNPGHDYVLIARSCAVTRPFNCLLDDLEQALINLDAPPRHKHISRNSRKA